MIITNATSPTYQAAVGNPFAGLAREAKHADAGRAAAANDTDDVGPREEAGKRRLARVVGPRIRHAREASGYSQFEAAGHLGYNTPAQASQHELGRRLPNLPMLIKIASLYSVTLDFLVGESPEGGDRDPARGTREACIRGVRNMLSEVAELTIETTERHARLVGADVGCTRDLLNSGTRLFDALQAFIRSNASQFENQRGSATLVRTGGEFDDALLKTRRLLKLHDARDIDLRAALAALRTADPTLLDDSEMGDD